MLPSLHKVAMLALGVLLLPGLPTAAAASVTFSDSMGDASPSEADLVGIVVDADGSDLTVTFELDDIRNDQGTVMYRLHFLLDDGATSTLIEVGCRYGGTAGLAVSSSQVLPVPLGINECWSKLPQGGFVDTSGAISAPSTFSAAADTITITVPYGDIGAAAGNTLKSFSAQTATVVAFIVSDPVADTASGGTTTLTL